MATIQKDHKIMELLKLDSINHLIAHTSKGDLTLQLRKGETKYQLVLDAVPVGNEIHDELMDLLYGIDIPQVNKNPIKESLQNIGEYLEGPKKIKSKSKR